MDINNLTRDEKSIILYAETCCVDHGGLLEGIRMNADDMSALEKYKAAGFLDYGRVPGKLLGTFIRQVTHWITLNDKGWELAHTLRRERAARLNESRKNVNAILVEREA